MALDSGQDAHTITPPLSNAQLVLSRRPFSTSGPHPKAAHHSQCHHSKAKHIRLLASLSCRYVLRSQVTEGSG
ncbi:hypothetical protein HanPSC8_Chr14g0623381 [Helianthus annuus]|nr:hypothetical protein HanPSC8_Chr14g0623381 [Helianthus annuus]